MFKTKKVRSAFISVRFVFNESQPQIYIIKTLSKTKETGCGLKERAGVTGCRVRLAGQARVGLVTRGPHSRRGGSGVPLTLAGFFVRHGRWWGHSHAGTRAQRPYPIHRGRSHRSRVPWPDLRAPRACPDGCTAGEGAGRGAAPVPGPSVPCLLQGLSTGLSYLQT